MILIPDSKSVEMLVQRVLIAAPRLAASRERPGVPEPILCGCPKAGRQRDGDDAGRNLRTPRSRALAGHRRFPHLQPNSENTVPNSARRTSIWLDSHHFPDARGFSSRKCATAHATADLFKKLELQVSLGVTGAASEEMARYPGAAS